ncbi:MAG TPA: hypothetical protein VJB65_04325, partial [Patescibacteria group bacterium]|nr:hypothetical protein [Patescibacteria group bacterium]
ELKAAVVALMAVFNTLPEPAMAHKPDVSADLSNPTIVDTTTGQPVTNPELCKKTQLMLAELQQKIQRNQIAILDLNRQLDSVKLGLDFHLNGGQAVDSQRIDNMERIGMGFRLDYTHPVGQQGYVLGGAIAGATFTRRETIKYPETRSETYSKGIAPFVGFRVEGGVTKEITFGEKDTLLSMGLHIERTSVIGSSENPQTADITKGGVTLRAEDLNSPWGMEWHYDGVINQPSDGGQKLPLGFEAGLTVTYTFPQ